jgi:hypothetical protein
LFAIYTISVLRRGASVVNVSALSLAGCSSSGFRGWRNTFWLKCRRVDRFSLCDPLVIVVIAVDDRGEPIHLPSLNARDVLHPWQSRLHLGAAAETTLTNHWLKPLEYQ